MVDKPLNGKLYGSIGHLVGSRTGKTDHYLPLGQCKIATEKTRDSHDLVIIQEKLDGSCCGCAKLDGKLVALTRSGNLCCKSQYIQHHYFEQWMYRHYDRFNALLHEGERVVGEGLWLAHGTKYDPTKVLGWEPWVAFDLMSGSTRLPYKQFEHRVSGIFKIPPLISKGPPRDIPWLLAECPQSRYGGEHVEGFIYRIERNEYAFKGPYVDFLCKYVSPEFEPGCLLPERSGKLIWNYGVSGMR